MVCTNRNELTTLLKFVVKIGKLYEFRVVEAGCLGAALSYRPGIRLGLESLVGIFCSPSLLHVLPF